MERSAKGNNALNLLCWNMLKRELIAYPSVVWVSLTLQLRKLYCYFYVFILPFLQRQLTWFPSFTQWGSYQHPWGWLGRECGTGWRSLLIPNHFTNDCPQGNNFPEIESDTEHWQKDPGLKCKEMWKASAQRHPIELLPMGVVNTDLGGPMVWSHKAASPVQGQGS